jgi:hypothetical protein
MLLQRVQVRPYYGQIELGDPNSSTFPQFETGDEGVVALPHYVVVATRGDAEGKVTIEVRQGDADVDDPRASAAIFDGELILSEDAAVIGNSVGNDLHPVRLGAGRHRLRVLRAPNTSTPDAVYFLVDPNGGSASSDGSA